MSAPEVNRTAARKLAANTLEWAARMVDAQQGDLLFSRQFKRRNPAPSRDVGHFVVSVYVGGVVRVRCLDSGALLAESKPGLPTVLADDFEPPIPPSWQRE